MSRAGSATKRLLELNVVLSEGTFFIGNRGWAWGEEKVTLWGFLWSALTSWNHQNGFRHHDHQFMDHEMPHTSVDCLNWHLNTHSHICTCTYTQCMLHLNSTQWVFIIGSITN